MGFGTTQARAVSEWSEGGRRRKREEWARLMLTVSAGLARFFAVSEVFKSKGVIGMSVWNVARKWLFLRYEKASRRSGMPRANEKSTLAQIYNVLRCEAEERSWGTKRSAADEHGNIPMIWKRSETCKKRDSPISPSDLQASRTLSGGCPLLINEWAQRIPYRGYRGQE